MTYRHRWHSRCHFFSPMANFMQHITRAQHNESTSSVSHAEMTKDKMTKSLLNNFKGLERNYSFYYCHNITIHKVQDTTH